MKKIIFFALVFTNLAAFAKTTKTPNVPNAGVPSFKDEAPYLAFNKPEKPMVVKRQIANNGHLGESDLSSEFKNYRDEFLRIKTAEQLDNFLDKTAANYKNYPNDVKVVATNLLMLKPLRGINLRVEKLLGSSSSVARRMKMIVGHALRNIDLFYNVDQGYMLREYLTTFSKKSITAPIPTISHLQNYLITEVYPVLINSAKNISEVESGMDNSSFYVFDNKMSYGAESFQDGLLRYRSYGKAELSYMLTNIYATLHEMTFVSAYNINDLLLVSDLLKYDQVFTKFIGFSFLNVAEERVKVITNNKGFLHMREENFSKSMMRNSYLFLAQAVNGAIKTWNLINERQSSPNSMINDERIKASYAKTSVTLTNLSALIEDKGFHPIRSQVTGEVAYVNLYAFFNSPPNDLTIFLPKTFDNKYGKANSWNLAPLSQYVKSNDRGLDSMDKVVRVLSQASGGNYISSLYLSL